MMRLVRMRGSFSHLALFAFVLAAALAGCARPARAPDAFVVAQQWEPHSLNPALENGDSSTEWSLLIFSYLVKYDDRGRLVPDVATEVPTLANGGISRDGKTIVYHIRKGIRFADGVPLTAEDCAWSVDAINNPANNVQSRFAYDDVERAEARDPQTLVLHLKRAFPPVIVVVEAPQGFPIFPKHALASLPDFNHAAFDDAPFGSGPYMVSTWQHGDRVELRANPNYWGGPVGIAHLTIQFVPSSQTAVNLMRTHEIDGYFNEQDYSNYPALQSVPGFRVTNTLMNGVGSMIFNTRDPVTGDARVRHALAEAVDIQPLVEKSYRRALAGKQPGSGLFLWAFDAAAYPDVPYDPADAKRLLDAAGWHAGADGMRAKDGHPLELNLIIQAATPGDAAFANNVVQAERAVGAVVTVKQFNITQFVAPSDEGGPVYGGKFQIALYPFENGDDPDTTDQFACKNVPPNGYNKSRFCNAEADALLRAGLATYDPVQRKAVYRQLQALLYRELPVALIYRITQINAFSNRLLGQTTSLSGAFWNVAHWHLQGAACKPKLWPVHGTYARTQTALQGPGLLLSGGGTDIDDAFRWMHRTLTGSASQRGGNVVVLTAYNDDDDYPPYILPLGPFQSVRTIGIPHCAAPSDVDALAPIVDGADAVFFSGGDQANYVPWKGGKLIEAVQRVWERGGIVGGSSAGLAVQGEVIYDSAAADRLHPNDDNYEVRTKNAVPNPMEPEISFTTGFLNWPPMAGIITDTHFARRDRFGRTVAFMALIQRAHLTQSGSIRALAVDERSALLVDKRGVATLVEYSGKGYKTRGAYLLSDPRVARLTSGSPLLATVRVLHLSRPGAQVDLTTGRGEGTTYDVTVDGSHKPPYDRSPY